MEDQLRDATRRSAEAHAVQLAAARAQQGPEMADLRAENEELRARLREAHQNAERRAAESYAAKAARAGLGYERPWERRH